MGKTNRNPSGEKLITFSIAGCGFISLVDEFKFKAGDVLDCEFQMEGMKKFKVQGAVLYTNPYPMGGQIGRFYGIRFLGDYESSVRPIVEVLESMTTEGRLRLAQ